MAVTILTAADTADVVRRHNVRTADIPTWGLTLSEEDPTHQHRFRRVMLGIRHATGEIRGYDVSLYDDDGDLFSLEAAQWTSWVDSFVDFMFPEFSYLVNKERKLFDALEAWFSDPTRSWWFWLGLGLFGVWLWKK